MKLRFILFSLIILAYNIQAQKIKEFSLDSVQFNEEIEIFFKNTPMPEEEKIEIDKFMIMWNNKTFEKSQYLRINKTLNSLLTFNTRPYPDFSNYLKVLAAFIENKKDSVLLKRWNQGVIELLSNKKTKVSTIANFFNFTYNLISDRYIYYSPVLSWKLSNDNYQFYFDENIYLKLINVTLICYAKRDSIKIHETKGILYPTENKYEGEKGIVNWERSGFGRDSVFVELNNFTIYTNKSEYTADSVYFTNKYYFSVKMLGQIEDKVIQVTTPENVLYPQFRSYDNNYHWSEMYPHIDYDGGFSFQGSRIAGHTSDEKDVTLSIKYNDTLRMKISSKFIIFLQEKVLSYKSSALIFLDEDSIFHPNLSFTYYVKRQEIILTKNEDYLSQSYYVNTYHQVFMNFEQIEWRIKQPFMKCTMLRSSAIGNAFFKSTNYFDLYDYEKQQGMDLTHPLILIKNFGIRQNSRSFNAIDFAHYINKPINQTRQLLLRLTVEGYIYYNPEEDMVNINNSLYSVIDARYGKIDYDVMNVISTTQSPQENAILDLNNFNLSINGIDKVFLSDSQNVIIYPANGKIKLKKNRDFEFDGVIVAGLFTFFGDKFYFDYSKFKIDMENVDSLKMKAQTDDRDFYNNPILMRVNNTIENITGDILIDAPDNKSGLQSLSQYPIFNSKKNSFLYYDDSYVQNGVYKRENFYFEIYPYTIDSLDNFNKDALTFDGYFVSADIFSPFEYQIYLMPDNSLGFYKTTVENGLPVYKGQGRFFNDFSMSNQGLRGNGTLKYLTSSIKSDDYIFFPDSTRAIAQNFAMKEQLTGIEYPMVDGENVSILWLPYEDELLVKQTDKPYNIFNENTSLTGTLRLRPSGLTGTGRMKVENSYISSKLYTYNAQSFHADTADLSIYNPGLDTVLFTTNNLKTNYSFTNGVGNFKTNDEAAMINLPENRYIGFAQNFSWKSREGKIDMKTEELVHVYERGEYKILSVEQREGNPVGNHFISVHPQQDSLDFVSTTALYDLNNKSLFADNVRFLKVADAIIYPLNGEVTIQKNARMNTLFDAEVLANRETKLYKFYNARISVLGKYSYNGEGDYDYIDENYRAQKIHLNKISVDDSIRTVAQGTIIEPDNFYISPKFAFQGNITLYANRTVMDFNGATKINHQCEDKSPTCWIRFNTTIDPRNIFIPIPEKPKDINQNPIFMGEYITNDSIHIYTSFLSRRKDYSDNLITTAYGFLHYSNKTGEYVISSKEKIFNRDTTGNLIALNRDICIFQGEGKINLGVDFWHFKVDQIGTLIHDLDKNAVRANLFMTIDFFFSQPALDIFAYEVDSIPGNEPVNMFTKSYRKNLEEFVGFEESQLLREDLSLYGSYRKLPDAFNHTIVINYLDLRWNQETSSYRSEGKIGISNIGNTQINKLIDGNLEIIKKRSGDIFHLYLKIDDKNWYLFTYTRGVLQSISSNDMYNTIIKETKPKDRNLKV
ncbi:MAG: hypothetical protein JXB17_06795, partial [Bacteroidales bacterium]|nr:hypothetical protein [Bacteroidales bacterium]